MEFVKSKRAFGFSSRRRVQTGSSSVSNLVLIIAVTLGSIGALSNIGDASERLVEQRTTSEAMPSAVGPASMAGTEPAIEVAATSTAGVGDTAPDISDLDSSNINKPDTNNRGSGQHLGGTGNGSFASCEDCLPSREEPNFFEQLFNASAEFGYTLTESLFGVHARPNAPDFDKAYSSLASNDGQRWLSPLGIIGGAAMTALSALRTGVSVALDSMYYPFMSPEQRFANTRDAAESTVWFAHSTGAYARLLWESFFGTGSDTAKGLKPSSKSSGASRTHGGLSIERGDRASYERIIAQLGVRPENSVYRSKERLLFAGKEHVAIEVSGSFLSGEYTIEAWHTPRQGASEQLFSETFEIKGQTPAEREASFDSQVAKFRAQALEQSDLDKVTVWNEHRWEDYENSQTGASQRVETVNSSLDKTRVHSGVTVTSTDRDNNETVVEMENELSFEALDQGPRYEVIQVTSN